MTPYVFETQRGRSFFRCLKSEYPDLCAAAIAEAKTEAGAPGAVEAQLSLNIAMLIEELPYNYPCRDIDIRHFTKLADDKTELSRIAGQIAAALLQNVGAESGNSIVKKS